jgi:hypothetical protein
MLPLLHVSITAIDLGFDFTRVKVDEGLSILKRLFHMWYAGVISPSRTYDESLIISSPNVVCSYLQYLFLVLDGVGRNYDSKSLAPAI